MTGKILVKQEKCTGCRSCEIACSYHQSRTFRPSISRIAVRWKSEIGEMEISMKEACDLCQSEIHPLCVKYCAPGALEHQQEES